MTAKAITIATSDANHGKFDGLSLLLLLGLPPVPVPLFAETRREGGMIHGCAN